jgi:hypothetical protein
VIQVPHQGRFSSVMPRNPDPRSTPYGR